MLQEGGVWRSWTSSTPRHTESKGTYKNFSLKKTGKLVEQLLHNKWWKGYFEIGKRGKDTVSQKNPPWHSNLQLDRISQIQSFSMRSEGFVPHISTSTPETCNNSWAFKTSAFANVQSSCPGNPKPRRELRYFSKYLMCRLTPRTSTKQHFEKCLDIMWRFIL